MARKEKKAKGVSLAKGPVALIGMALLAYGITGLLFGGRGFAVDVPSGTINGETWLGLEVNGWSNLLFIAAGALLLFGSPVHWGAKTMSMLVGLALGAASVIALVDGEDVLGIFAANGLTKLVWGAAAALLLILALLPRVGGGKDRDREREEREREHERERRMLADERSGGRVDRERDRDGVSTGSRAAADDPRTTR
jgi:hypothetical protein